MPSLIERYEAYAIDLDGVIWVSRKLIAGAAEGIQALRESGKRFLLLTNNATYSAEMVIDTLESAGVSVEGEEVLNSAMVLRDWIEERGLVGSPAFILGEQSVVQQLSDILEVVELKKGSRAELVVVARDVEFTFQRLAIVSDALRDGAGLVAMNRDTVLPTDKGFEPGTGAVLAAIEVASGVTAEVIGKPELPMMTSASGILNSESVLMIGDRLDSDVAGARRVGWDAAIVLTGVTQPRERYDPSPDYVLDSLTDISLDLNDLRTRKR